MLISLFNAPAITASYTLSLHDALPIYTRMGDGTLSDKTPGAERSDVYAYDPRYPVPTYGGSDRKSTRLNSSHEWISYAVFCLKKKKLNTSGQHLCTKET